jgi:hypothetical protein
MVYIDTKTARDIIGETALWQSVIMQATLDATSQPSDIKGRIERAKTIAWFSTNNEDFLEVCSLANFDPQTIIAKLKATLQKQKKRPKRRKIKNKLHRAHNCAISSESQAIVQIAK